MKTDSNTNSVPESLRASAYSLMEGDLKRGAEVMAAAFHDDPAIRYLLGGETLGEDDWRYFLTVLKAIYGKCVLLSSDETVQNLLILFPPRYKSVPAFPFLMKGGLVLWRYFGMALYSRSVNYENNCCRIKKRFLAPDTWYCMCFAVMPEKQGRGVGSCLIKPVLRAMDEHHIPLYHETHKEINTYIYAHLGFDTVDISNIPGTAITQYAMRRKAKGQK